MTDRPPHANHHCRHYDHIRTVGDWGAKCAAGIDLRCEGASTRPCMPQPISECAWREEYTDAERDAWDAWMKERAGRALRVMMEIPDGKEQWGKTGQFVCPACSAGIVRWSRARTNGHIHARCSTVDCFSVMQ